MTRRRHRFGVLLTAGMVALTSPGIATASPKTNEALAVEPHDYLIGGWELYRSRFVTPEGRVTDDDNGSISHSEGQGYGMLLAVGADDRATFELLWNWTNKELFIRSDGLAAWRWDPKAEPRVTDMNDATDGDLLIAWALLRAAERWKVPDWRARARQITDAVAEHGLAKVGKQTVLMPGVQGFAAGEQSDGPVINLSYWVFPALSELEAISPALAKAELGQSGLSLARSVRFGKFALPSDWASLAGPKPAPAKSFPSEFGYNAVRVPLYLAWEGGNAAALLKPYAELWQPTGVDQPHVIDVATDLKISMLDGPGYGAIADLVACATSGFPASERTKSFVPTTYYPSTLHLLSLMAFAERYPRCL